MAQQYVLPGYQRLATKQKILRLLAELESKDQVIVVEDILAEIAPTELRALERQVATVREQFADLLPVPKPTATPERNRFTAVGEEMAADAGALWLRVLAYCRKGQFGDSFKTLAVGPKFYPNIAREKASTKVATAIRTWSTHPINQPERDPSDDRVHFIWLGNGRFRLADRYKDPK